MYVKVMHSNEKITGSINFTIIEVHKGQRISCSQPPGQGMEIQIITEDDQISQRLPLYGPAYIMNESGKTIASYGVHFPMSHVESCSDFSAGKRDLNSVY